MISANGAIKPIRITYSVNLLKDNVNNGGLIIFIDIDIDIADAADAASVNNEWNLNEFGN